ncbi:TonB family protein [Bradyrhizobium sp. 31Argb]|uniref:TonB family protein n=1 Tax=Bradyrhizobium sp. 31Argb TaxID=3141247 RepID=UPI00374A67F8
MGIVLTGIVPVSAQSRRFLLCGTLVFVLSLCAQTTAAQERRIEFNIPAQAIDKALDAFGAISGFQIFYETALTAGRQSKAVNGVFARETALRLLLEGSNLTAHIIAADTITIAPSNTTNADLHQAKRAAVSYYGFMQAGIMSALCRSATTRPGTYRLAMEYWIDASGRITELRVIRSSGDQQRDGAIAQAIRTVVFQPPLVDIPQPVTLAIEPSPPQDLAGCMPDRVDAERVR